MKNNRLMRPCAALFPLSLIAAQAITGETTPMMLLIVYFLLQLFSLCSVDCFRNAAAREPGPRRADRRFWNGVPMLIFAPILLAAGIMLMGSRISRENLTVIAIPWLIIIEQLFEERLYTLNRRFDGNVLAMVSNGLLFTGLMLDGSNGLSGSFELFWTLAAAGTGVLIAAITCLTIAPVKGFSLSLRNLGFAPKALVQVLLYPAAMYGALELTGWKISEGMIWGFYLGFALWRLSKTVCRRSADESRSLSLMLITVCALAMGGIGWCSCLMDIAFCCLIALICAMIMYIRPSVRNVCGSLLVIAGFVCAYLKMDYANYIAIGCGLIAIIVNLKNVFLKKV